MRYLLLAMVLACLFGCQPNLSSDAAGEILRRSLDLPVQSTCQWADAMERTGDSQGVLLDVRSGSGESFRVDRETQQGCLDTLATAGFVLDHDAPAFSLTGGAYFDTHTDPVTVEFPCALAQLDRVTQLTTTADRTHVSFTLRQEQPLPQAQPVIEDPNLYCTLAIRSTWICEASLVQEGGEWSVTQVRGAGCSDDAQVP